MSIVRHREMNKATGETECGQNKQKQDTTAVEGTERYLDPFFL